MRVNHLQVLNRPSLRISPKRADELLLRVAKHGGSDGGGLPISSEFFSSHALKRVQSSLSTATNEGAFFFK
jgi:hypothetical protein